MPSTLLPLSSSIGINNTPFINAWHGKPGIALAPQQSSAENGVSGSIAGLPSRPYIARSISACSCYDVAHHCTPCRFGVIANHLQPRPTKLPTQRYSVIPSKIVVCHYHNRGKHGVKLVAITARIGGFGPMLRKMEGGPSVCLLFWGCTDCCGSIISMCWGWEDTFYTLPPTPYSCHSYPTHVPFLRFTC
jgi:hypothetical protein